jgi:hypothetical protein
MARRILTQRIIDSLVADLRFPLEEALFNAGISLNVYKRWVRESRAADGGLLGAFRDHIYMPRQSAQTRAYEASGGGHVPGQLDCDCGSCENERGIQAAYADSRERVTRRQFNAAQATLRKRGATAEQARILAMVYADPRREGDALFLPDPHHWAKDVTRYRDIADYWGRRRGWFGRKQETAELPPPLPQDDVLYFMGWVGMWNPL